MNTTFIKVITDVYCDYPVNENPIYRVYVSDELFAERAWIWREVYLEEMLQIQAAPGIYPIRFELVGTNEAKLSIKNMRIEYGTARIIDNSILEIYNENSGNS